MVIQPDTFEVLRIILTVAAFLAAGLVVGWWGLIQLEKIETR